MSSCSILIIGDELLLGEIQDENGPWLIEQMVSRGVDVRNVCLVPDDPEYVAGHLERQLDEDYVLTTGGIGPTLDDRTPEAVARALGRPRVLHDEVLRQLESYYGDSLNQQRRDMARLPEGAEVVFVNQSPALSFRVRNVYVFPGIPALLKPLFRQWEEAFRGETRATRTYTCRGREGDLAPLLEQLALRFPDVQIGSYPHADGTVTVRVRGSDEDELEEALDWLRAAL